MKNPALAISSFVILALVLTLGGIVWLGGSHLFETRLKAVISLHDSVAGLSKGAVVTFRGLSVGLVDSIGLETAPAAASRP